MPDVDANPRTAYPCPHCSTGTLRLRRVVFAQWFAGQFILIPNFPGWVCSLCGEREYDAVALEQVQLILGAEADPQPESGRRAWPSPPPMDADSRPNGRRLI